ncbi:MAG: Nif3-like dinuclear metal center hexameric protein [Pseudonocardiaceae bacterium]|nr:Nif3-like dinuclear metal center hexameric protein [Pseudonocardiaceae bacterium]
MTANLGDVVAALEGAYPPALAESWDAVGLVCGDPDEPVRRVLVAVDPVAEVVDEALDGDAQLLVTHHPLLLRGVHGVPADDPKGALVHRLVRAGAGLFCAHTNADRADPGVSDALAAALGLTVAGPMRAAAAEPLDVLAVAVPVDDTARVLDALAAAGAGQVGDYSHGAWTVEGTGQFVPQPGASPTVGRVGERERVAETRVEMVLPRRRRGEVLAALRAAHPYEQPAYSLHEQAETLSTRGLGRIGELHAAEPLGAFADRVAAALPATAWGVRAAGDPHRHIQRVAVCGGAGDPLLATAGAGGVDAFVTADLRHHPASEHVEAGGPALVDVAHWASEHPWCEQAASVIVEALGGTVDVLVSYRRTDPWTIGAAQPTGRSTR